MLLRQAGHVLAIEIDERLVSILNDKFSKHPNIDIIKGDFLQLDLTELITSSTLFSDKSKVVANLPYYITSPAILELLRNSRLFERLVLLVQREVAERIVAAPGSKEYGAFSVAVQYHAQPEIIATVPPEAFWPQPKVDSAVIRILVCDTPTIKTIDEEIFFSVVRGGFSKRRKTILRALSMAGKTFPKLSRIREDSIRQVLLEVGVDSKRRAETLSLNEFSKIADAIAFKCGELNRNGRNDIYKSFKRENEF